MVQQICKRQQHFYLCRCCASCCCRRVPCRPSLAQLLLLLPWQAAEAHQAGEENRKGPLQRAAGKGPRGSQAQLLCWPQQRLHLLPGSLCSGADVGGSDVQLAAAQPLHFLGCPLQHAAGALRQELQVRPPHTSGARRPRLRQPQRQHAPGWQRPALQQPQQRRALLRDGGGQQQLLRDVQQRLSLANGLAGHQPPPAARHGCRCQLHTGGAGARVGFAESAMDSAAYSKKTALAPLH